MSTIWGFDHIENKHTLYRGKIVLEKKKVLPLTKEELKSY